MQKLHDESQTKASELTHSLSNAKPLRGVPRFHAGRPTIRHKYQTMATGLIISGMAFETVFKWSSVFCLEIIGNQNGVHAETIGNQNGNQV